MKKLAIGIMSGTSLDGVDVSLCEIEGFFNDTEIKEIYSNKYPYDQDTINKIKRILDNEFTLQDICEINVELAQLYSNCVFALCDEADISVQDIDFIASHGQTIYHVTKEMGTPSSLQLGDGSILANLTNTTVISNFRQADIAKGGTGAPLVPYVDYILLHSTTHSRVIQNIGGISNSTYLQKEGTLDDVIAFDNGPGNMMIDYAMNKLFNQKYDQDGLIALNGDIIESMAKEVLNQEYFRIKPPKSTGRELFGNEYTETLLQKYSNHSKEDIITTLTYITAYSISHSLEQFIDDEIDALYVCGGGAKNKAILSFLETQMSNTIVRPIDILGISSEYKEAMAFIVLGNETINHNPSNCKKATGATEYTILGQITYVK